MRSSSRPRRAPPLDPRGRLPRAWDGLGQLARARSGAIAVGMLLVGLLWRVALVALDWPPTNSDEGFTGLMAMHIAFRGAHPIFFYGSSYEGPLDAYLTAAVFRLFGPSLFGMRLTIMLVSMLAIGCVFLLVQRLYGPGLALAALALLAAGTPEALSQQTFARGGYAEMLLFSALALLLAVELTRGTRGLNGRARRARRGTRRNTATARTGWSGREGIIAEGAGGRATARASARHKAPAKGREPTGVHIRRAPVARAVKASWGSQIADMPAPRRLAMYAGLGVAVGLGVWAQTLAVPFALAALALVAALRGRELRTRAGLCLALGLLVGTAPLLRYAIQAPDHNPFGGALSVQQSGSAYQGNVLALFAGEVIGPVVNSVPIITGGAALLPLDARHAWPLSTQGGWRQVLAYAVHGLWGIGVLALLVVALVRSVRAVRARWGARRKEPSASVADEGLARACGRLALLAGAGLTLLLFAASPAAARAPETVARYLLGLLLALGAVLAPLWAAARGSRARARVLAGAALAVIGMAYVAGVWQTIGALPAAAATRTKQEALVRDLEHLGATRIYSGYWTCGLVIFLSQERIVCAALNERLQPDLDRYPPYRTMVERAADPFYVFPLDSPQAAAFAARAAVVPGAYRRWQLDGYAVYQAIR